MKIMEIHITVHAAYARVERNSTIKPINSTISNHANRAYGGEGGWSSASVSTL
jgi:hypothetical protein